MHFRYYLLLEKGGGPSFKQTQSSAKDAFYQVCLKLVQRFCRIFLNFDNAFSLCRNYLPLEKSERYLSSEERSRDAFPNNEFDSKCSVFCSLQISEQENYLTLKSRSKSYALKH